MFKSYSISILIFLLFKGSFLMYAIKSETDFQLRLKGINKNIEKKNDSTYQGIYNLYKEKKYPEALKEGLITYNNAINESDFYLTYKTSELISDIYKKSFNYKLSLKYLKISLDNLKKYNSSFGNDNIAQNSKSNLFSRTYLKLGSTYLKIYRNLKNKNTDINYQKLLDIGISKDNSTEFDQIKDIDVFKDSTLYYFKKLEELPSINDKILINKANSYTNLSVLYQLDSMYLEAKEYVIKAIEVHKKRNDKIKIAKSLSNLGSIHLSTGDFNGAKKTYIEGIETIKKDESEEAIKTKASLYFNLAWAMRNLKDYEAYDYQELSYEIKDFLRDKNIQQLVKKIEANHKENLEAQKIESIKEQRKLLEAKDSKAQLLFSLLSILVLLISGVVIYNYKLRQKNLQLKLSESNLLQQQSIEKLKSEAQIKILNATIDGKEEERKLIAETLHDNVSALLSSANLHLSATKKQHNGSTPIEVEKTRAIILEASQKVRDLSHNLISSILLKFGLEYALKDVAKKYSNRELNFVVSAQNINRYNQDFEIKIFNIIQELINNIIKHSKANQAKIALKEEKNQLTILIRDDGVGFAPSSSSIKDGIGLNQIDARVHIMNGKFIISSEPNKGTEAIITVPIKQHKKEFKLTSVS